MPRFWPVWIDEYIWAILFSRIRFLIAEVPIMLEEENRYLTGRTFEVPLCGALLVQEVSPLTHHYFIPGEHFLEFSTISELVGVMRFINEHREEAEEIRRCGNAFARERYNDAQMVAHFDHFLYSGD